MQNSQMGTQRVSVLLFDGFSNLCLANAVEPLRAANSLAGKPLYAWEYAGLSLAPIVSSSGLSVQPAKALTDCRGEFLLVTPSYGHRALDTPACRRALISAERRFDVVGGFDTGSWLLASAGLLNGHCATSHWDILDELAEAFPEVEVTEERFVISGNRISCGGATTTLELLLELIAREHGKALALEIAALFMHGERTPPFPDAIKGKGSANQQVLAVAALMRRHVEEPLRIAQIAAQLELSRRALEQICRDHAGRNPAALYRAIRLSQARRLLKSTGMGVAEAASRCGYADPTAFTRAYRAEFGETPSQSRR